MNLGGGSAVRRKNRGLLKPPVRIGEGRERSPANLAAKSDPRVRVPRGFANSLIAVNFCVSLIEGELSCYARHAVRLWRDRSLGRSGMGWGRAGLGTWS